MVDEELRGLERAAAAGDVEAASKLSAVRARLRARPKWGSEPSEKNFSSACPYVPPKVSSMPGAVPYREALDDAFYSDAIPDAPRGFFQSPRHDPRKLFGPFPVGSLSEDDLIRRLAELNHGSAFAHFPRLELPVHLPRWLYHYQPRPEWHRPVDPWGRSLRFTGGGHFQMTGTPHSSV